MRHAFLLIPLLSGLAFAGDPTAGDAPADPSAGSGIHNPDAFLPSRDGTHAGIEVGRIVNPITPSPQPQTPRGAVDHYGEFSVADDVPDDVRAYARNLIRFMNVDAPRQMRRGFATFTSGSDPSQQQERAGFRAVGAAGDNLIEQMDLYAEQLQEYENHLPRRLVEDFKALRIRAQSMRQAGAEADPGGSTHGEVTQPTRDAAIESGAEMMRRNSDAIIQGAPSDTVEIAPGITAVVPRLRPEERRDATANFTATAQLQLRRGNPQAAFQYSAAAVANAPEDPAANAAMARTLYDSRDFQGAMQFSERALQYDAGRVDALVTRGLANYNLGDHESAFYDADKALQLNPYNTTAHAVRAMADNALRARGIDMSGKAKGELLASVGRQPSMPGGGMAPPPPGSGAGGPGAGISGSRDAVLGQAVQSIPAASADLKATPPIVKQQYMQVKSAMEKGDYGQVIERATKIIQRNPHEGRAYVYRALASNYTGNYDHALIDADTAIGLGQGTAQSYNVRAWARYKVDDAHGAEGDAGTAITLDPNNGYSYLTRALAREKTGDYTMMLEDFRIAAELNPQLQPTYEKAIVKYQDMQNPRDDINLDPTVKAPFLLAGSDLLPRLENSRLLRGFDKKKRRVMAVGMLSGALLVALGLLSLLDSGRRQRVTRAIKTTLRMQAREAVPQTQTVPASAVETVVGGVPGANGSASAAGLLAGKYELVNEIGRGGMGVVYEAMDHSLDRKVAVKKMRDEIQVNKRERRAFIQEAKMVASLNHPNIVNIHQIFEQDGDIYLVFEFVDGKTVDDLIDDAGRVPIDTAVSVLKAAASALDFAHQHQVVHRDLKPSNIMLAEHGLVKVMDFGIARQAKDTVSRYSNVETSGTPAYMAPEQEKGVVGPSGDVFALAATFYEMITGDLPFPGPNFLLQKSERTAPPPTVKVPGLPPALDAVLHRALSPDIQERFPSAGEFAAAIEAASARPV